MRLLLFSYIEKNEIDKKLKFQEEEIYFCALELLRSHIYLCLIQISKIASIKIPKISDLMRYNDKWELIYYEK